MLYEVKVQGATNSVRNSSRLITGEFSESRKVVLQSKCESKCTNPFQLIYLFLMLTDPG